jgi:hypothetical protein
LIHSYTGTDLELEAEEGPWTYRCSLEAVKVLGQPNGLI